VYGKLDIRHRSQLPQALGIDQLGEAVSPPSTR
jgi:hypothetical protein